MAPVQASRKTSVEEYKYVCYNASLFQVGDSVPSINLFEDTPDKAVNLAQLCSSGKFVLFGVPGAFTPGCSKTHLPGTCGGARGVN